MRRRMMALPPSRLRVSYTLVGPMHCSHFMASLPRPAFAFRSHRVLALGRPCVLAPLLPVAGQVRRAAFWPFKSLRPNGFSRLLTALDLSSPENALQSHRSDASSLGHNVKPPRTPGSGFDVNDFGALG